MFHRSIAAVACLSSSLGATALAEDLIIVPAEVDTIQEAIDQAQDGDHIFLQPGVYIENIDFRGKNVRVGGNDPATTIITPLNGASIVTFNSGEGNGAILEFVTLADGTAVIGGGLRISKSSPTIRNCIIRDGVSHHGGGGYVSDDSHPRFQHCTFTGNVAGAGAGLLVWDSELDLEGCRFEDNEAWELGGGVALSRSRMVALATTWSKNTAQDLGGEFAGYGGGVSAWFSEIELMDCSFMKNAAEIGGGMSAEQSTVTLNNVIYDENTAGNVGGGMYLNSVQTTMDSCTVSSNEALFGGGIASSYGRLDLTVCSVVSNSALMIGGGLDLRGGTATMLLCEVERNKTDGTGGGVSLWSQTTQFRSSQFRFNESQRNGAALWMEDSVVASHDCLFEFNQAEELGGVCLALGGRQHWVECRMRNNSALQAGGALYNSKNDWTIIDCQITDNLTHDSAGAMKNNNCFSAQMQGSRICGNTVFQIVGGFVDLGGNSISNDCQGCPGDTNNDGVVDVKDLIQLIDHWGPCLGCGADLDGDGLVGVTDLLEVINAWGNEC